MSNFSGPQKSEEQRRFLRKIVTIGGGTGHYTLLRGLKNYDVDLTAVVSVADNGGSSGELRTEFGILPPGDIRNCLLALADDIKLKDLMDLFEYRFSGDGTLANHNLGNLILTALIRKHNDIGLAIKAASNILNISGKILPVTTDRINILAETHSGKILNGQSEVSYPNKDEKISRVWLEKPAFIYRESAEALREADLIIICPGDLYGSIIPNFLITGLKEAIPSTTKLVYVCNLATKQGTIDFKASDFLKEIEKYLNRKVDLTICNIKQPSGQIVDKYKKEDSFFVKPDLPEDRMIKDELLLEYPSGDKTIARHDSERIARIIMGL